jgi:hypothetical protein
MYNKIEIKTLRIYYISEWVFTFESLSSILEIAHRNSLGHICQDSQETEEEHGWNERIGNCFG